MKRFLQFIHTPGRKYIILRLKMEDIVTLERNPYPVPDLSREGTWIGEGPVLSKNVVKDDYNWDAKVKTHDRLFSHHTLNTARRDCRYRATQLPRDSLDLILSSVYEHNEDLFVPKMYTHIQPESMNEETWRVLRNQIKVYTKPPVPLGHEIRYAPAHRPGEGARRNVHPSSLPLAMEGPHTDRTNPGFSRKIDGTFYGI